MPYCQDTMEREVQDTAWGGVTSGCIQSRSRVTQAMRRALKKKGQRGTSSYKPPFLLFFSDFSWWQWRGDECADPARSPTALQTHAFLTVPRPRPHCSDPARSPTALQPHALLTVPRPITVKGKLEKLQTPVFKKKKDIMNGERQLTHRMTFSTEEALSRRRGKRVTR